MAPQQQVVALPGAQQQELLVRVVTARLWELLTTAHK
jgi:hypothetical protein